MTFRRALLLFVGAGILAALLHMLATEFSFGHYPPMMAIAFLALIIGYLFFEQVLPRQDTWSPLSIGAAIACLLTPVIAPWLFQGVYIWAVFAVLFAGTLLTGFFTVERRT